MKVVESSFQTKDQLQIFTRKWLPVAPVKAGIVLVHGMAEHSGRYQDIAGEFTERGIALYSYDARGHGRSSGPKCYIDDFQEYLDDLDLFMKSLASEAGDKPLFILGHSAGGEVVAAYALNYQPKVQGIILSSPALKPGADISPILIALSGVVNFLAPKSAVLALDPGAISRMPAQVQAYRSDPLVYHGKLPTRTGYQMQRYFSKI